MHRQGLSQQIVLAILITLLLVGCGSPAPSPTPIPPTEIPTATPEPTAEPETVNEVTFYGDSCDVTTPEELPAGKTTFILKDLDGTTDAVLYVGRLTDGHVYQDLLDRQEAPGDYVAKPDWLVYPRKMGGTPNAQGETTYQIWLEAGENAIYIVNWLPTSVWGLWFCAPVMVVEPASE